MQSYVVNIRRKLHEIPEIGFDLDKTISVVKEELDKMEVEYTERFGKSSVVAYLGSKKSERCVAIRADMDALPICEAGDKSYRSKHEGKMHACGHDAHTAMALDAVRRLKAMEDSLPCLVAVLFQPAEEYNVSGAKLMADDGVMSGVDEAISIHVDPSYPAGYAAISSGPQNAVSCGFKLKFLGKSAHVAVSHEGVDAIMMAVSAYTDIQLMLKRQMPAGEAIIFNAGSIHGGIANNIVCDECELFCTLRTLSDEVCESVVDKIKRIISSTASAFGGRCEYIPVKYYPVLVNDDAVTQKAKSALLATLSEDKILPKERDMIGEDFAYFAKITPSCMIRLGIRNESLGITSALHSETFDIDESALAIGSDFFVNYILSSPSLVMGRSDKSRNKFVSKLGVSGADG